MARVIVLTFRAYANTIKTIAVFGLLWLAIRALPVHEDDVILQYSATEVLVVAVLTSNSLRTRLSSARVHTVPGYRRVHMTGVFGLSAINLLLVTGVAVSRGLPLTNVVMCLWFFSVLAWIAGYFLPGLVRSFPRFLPLIMIMVAILGAVIGLIFALVFAAKEPIFHSFEHIKARLPWEFAVLFILVNSAATILMVRRILHLNEEAFEYFHTHPREMARALYQNKEGPRSASLDSIQAALPARLGPQLKHLGMVLFPGTPAFLRVVGVFTAIFLAIRFFYKGPATILLGAAIGIPTGSYFFTRQAWQRLFLLPLSRRELVAKGGSALLLAGLRMWCACVLALTIAFWDIPWEILLISLVMQLPFFGIVALARSIRAPLANGKPLLLIPALLSLGLMVAWISTTPLQVQIAICVVAGSGLIWMAYHRWCNVELD